MSVLRSIAQRWHPTDGAGASHRPSARMKPEHDMTVFESWSVVDGKGLRDLLGKSPQAVDEETMAQRGQVLSGSLTHGEPYRISQKCPVCSYPPH